MSEPDIEEKEYVETIYRVSAFLLDMILLIVSLFLISELVEFISQQYKGELSNWTKYFIWGISLFIILWLYPTLMDVSRFQGSLGKILLKIKVTDMNGNKISFVQSTLRNIFKFVVSAVIIIISYLIAEKTNCIPISLAINIGLLSGFFRTFSDSQKQAFYDKIAGTLVLSK